MFSFLSRGYGTWEGIAKLEKPDSAISNRGISSGDFFLPPINPNRHPLYQPTYTYPDLQYKIPRDDIKLPEVTKDESLHIPKTYSTKSGALLLYSEGHFKPGSRRLKKRPRLRKKKEERRIQTLKDLTNLIMEYKKNECDPLLLAHLWRKANNSGRDLRPGFSPQRYLTHLGYTALDPDSWKKLAESGSLKGLGTMEEDGFLPLLFQDREFGDKLLRQRPQPYSTMSLPPVSPSSSMLGSFTFYKHGMSTGAASLVSMNSDSLEDFSAKTAGTYVESLAERLEEVESESGFKRSYETLSAKEKEELLTQLLMDVTLHNQGEFSPILPEHRTESPTPATIVSTFSETKSSTKSIKRSKSLKSDGSSKSLKSVGSSKSLKSVGSSKSLKSVGSSKSLKSVSKSSVFSSVCSLPPIVSTKAVEDTDPMEIKNSRADQKLNDSLSSSGSGLGLTEDCLTVGLDGVDFELVDSSFHLEHSSLDAHEHDADQTSTSSEKAFSEHSLIEALQILEGDSVHELNDDIKSVKSLVASEKLWNSSEEDGDTLSAVETGIVDDGHPEDIGRDNTNFRGDGGGDSDGDGVGSGGDSVVGSVSSGDYGDDDGGVGSGDGGSGVRRDGGVGICVNSGDNVGGYDGGDEDGDSKPTETNPNQGQKMLHLSLTNLQDEVRLVAGQVLSRPKSGRFLVEDAKVATALLVERIEALLGPSVTDNIRVSSATAREVRPLGQPRNSEVSKKSKTLNKNERTIRSAGPTLASTSYVEPTNDSSPPDQEEKDAENGTESVSSEVERLSEKNEVQNDQKEIELDEKDIKLDKKEIELDKKEIELDDIVLSTSEVEEPGPQPVEVASETPPPESDSLTVKDLKSTDKPKQGKPKDETVVKEKKESVKKAGKGKTGINAKKSNVTKGKRKKKSNARAAAQNESPKASPFRAGLAPEQKPPKGLDLKPGEVPVKRSDTKAAQETKTASEEETPEVEKKVEEVSNHLATPAIETRVDSETGEIERGETPLISEKTPSPLEISSSTEKTPSIEQVPSPREETPSPSHETISPREKSPSPREKTPSPREKSSPESAVVEDSGVPTREPSPEVQVVVSERVQRANARAAQRAAAAERRRQEVERKRREREETRKKAQEEEARLEELRREADEEMKKRGEERRVQKEQEERERRRLEAEEKEHARQEKLLAERQRFARDEWKRKKEQLLAQRKLEEEMRLERERIEHQIEEERRREYEARIAHLEEEERERLMEERRLEEERIKREIEEERLQREEERRRVLEERRRMEEELEALRDRQLARQLFLEGLLKDYQNLLLDQRISRAFTFSYFDIMPWFKETWDSLEETSVSASLPTVREDEEIDVD